MQTLSFRCFPAVRHCKNSILVQELIVIPPDGIVCVAANVEGDAFVIPAWKLKPAD